MERSYDKDVKLFMIFDLLGDLERTGPHLWHISRKRLEDVKDHILDLILITRILRRRFPNCLDYDKIYDYIICHDLPEAITDDITKFQGVPEEDIERVTRLATDFLDEHFHSVMDFKEIIGNYEARIDLESKVVNMVDKVHSSTTFTKYQSEENIDVDHPDIIPILRYHPFVAERIVEGKDVADIFYEFHIRAVKISDEECEKYHISRETADQIVDDIRGFAGEFYAKKLKGTLFDGYKEFPKEAMQYRRNQTD